MTPRKIVVPIDFSPHSQAAAELALAQLEHTGGELRLIHADPLPGASAATPEPFYIAPQLWSSLTSAHAKRVAENLESLRRELSARAPEGASVYTDLVHRDPARGILEYAEAEDADLIALGSHGASAATLYLFGSVTERVAREAPCPVLVTNDDIRVGFEERDAKIRPFERALVGVDYSPLSARAAREAAGILAPGGVLEVVHVWHAPHLPTMELGIHTRDDELYELLETYRRAEVERLSKFILDLDLGLADENLHAYIEVGTAARGMLHRAQETNAELIVLGAHGRETLEEKIVGTVADRVIRTTSIPALLIPETAARTHGAPST